MRTLRQQGGVTLIEASVVSAIVAISTAFAIPSFQNLVEKQRLDGAATQLATDIQFVRSEAVMRNVALRLSVHTDAWGSCYVVHSGNANDCVCPAAGPAQCSGAAQPIKTVRLPAEDHVALQANVSSILFDPMHGTSTPTGTLKVVAASGRAVHHVVNVMGRVRSCSPRQVAPAVPGYRVC